MPLGPMKTKAQKRAGAEQVMHEFKHGQLHSGSKTGPVVKNRKQAIAIMMKQTGQSRYQLGGDVPPLPITPDIAIRMQRRLENATDDASLRRVVRDAAKYGVDWSHQLERRSGGRIGEMRHGGTVAGHRLDRRARGGCK